MLILHSYFANVQELSRVSIINDLGVLFDSELRFTGHIDWVISKSFRMLGFVWRQCHDFRDAKVLKLIFYSLVRSHLDYCCAIWSPCYRVHIWGLREYRWSSSTSFFISCVLISPFSLIVSAWASLASILWRSVETLSFGHKILTCFLSSILEFLHVILDNLRLYP